MVDTTSYGKIESLYTLDEFRMFVSYCTTDLTTTRIPVNYYTV